MAPVKSVQIVIIGGSHGGLAVAQAVLNTISAATVTVISTSKDYYFNLAAPRILARPSEVTLDQVLIPIDRLFKKYPSSRFEFVHATVTSFNPTGKSITTDTNQTFKYDYLVIASGSHTPSVIADRSIPVKQNTSDTIRQTMPTAQKTIADANRIVIGGGGPVAVELAGEIADAYPSKSVTIVTATSRLLHTLKEGSSAEAAKMLTKLKVEIRTDLKVQGSYFDKEKKEWTVDLSDETQLKADLYIPAVGILPNNSFIPPEFLSKDGWVKVDANLGVVSLPSVYALGDIIEGPTKVAAITKDQSKLVAGNLAADINGTGRKPFKPGFLTGMVVPIGKLGGTGQINSFIPWSWVVSKVKGDFFLSKTNMFVADK
jgi:NADH dehydrogenase FAD-containing subunit